MKGNFTRKTIAIALALGLAGTGGALTSCSKKAETPKTESQAAEATPTGTLQFDVHANQDDTWTPDSSPLIAHIESAEQTNTASANSNTSDSTDEQQKAQPQTSFYHAIKPAQDGSSRVSDTVTVPAGTYRIRYITPVNMDGSAFAVGNAEAGKASTGTSNSPAHEAVVTAPDPVAEDAASTISNTVTPAEQPTAAENQPAEETKPAEQPKPAEETQPADGTTVPPETTTPVDTPIDHVPADQVTDGELQEIVDNTGTAVENGDDSLKGENGKDAVTKVEEGVKNNPNASDQTKTEATETKDTAPVDQPAVQPEQPKPATGGNNGGNSGGNTGGGQPAVQPEQPKPQQPQQPKPDTPKQLVCTTVTEYETYTDYETRTEQVLVRAAYTEYRFADGFVTTDPGTARQHARQLALQGSDSGFGTRDYPAQYETRTTQVPVQKQRPVQKQVCE